VSFGPNGAAHQISLSFNNTANLDNAVLVSKSPASSAGQQWKQHGTFTGKALTIAGLVRASTAGDLRSRP
jgi:hypothetical protein